tara:strand:- start:3250 stop:3384 length:135 start_codon:yes stop_codon:yes gene_type:complete
LDANFAILGIVFVAGVQIISCSSEVVLKNLKASEYSNNLVSPIV